MTLTIKNTSKTVTLNGLPARVWEGHTESGIQVHCFITRVAVKDDQDCSQFEKELKECSKPSMEVEAFPLRLIL